MSFVKVTEHGKDVYYNSLPTRIVVDVTTNDLIISYESVTYRIDLDINPSAREDFLGDSLTGKKSKIAKPPKRKTN